MKKLMKSTKSKSTSNSFLTLIMKHLKQIPFIIVYPLTTVISLVHALFYTIYHKADDTLSTTKLEKKRLEKSVRKSVQTILRGNTNILSSFMNRRVSNIATFLLQMISFLSTYAGFSFFLSGLNAIAPFCAAFVVQGICYFLMNYSSGKKRKGHYALIALLLLLISISMFTSFIGVSNTVDSPVRDMKLTYEAYRTKHNEIIDKQLQNTNYATIDSTKISSAFNSVDLLISEADAKIKSLNEQLSEITTTSSSSRRTYDGLGGRTFIDDSTPIETLEMAKTELTDKRDDISTARESLDGIRSALDAAAVINVYETMQTNAANASSTADLMGYLTTVISPDEIQHYTSFHEMIQRYNILIDDLSSKSSKLSETEFEITVLTNSAAETDKLEEARVAEYDDLVNSLTTTTSSSAITWLNQILSAVNAFNEVVISEELTKPELIRTTLSDEINSKYTLLSSGLISGQKTNDELDALYKDTTFISTHLVPIRNLISSDNPNRGLSFFSLGIAFIFDILSLLIALVLVPKRTSVLYKNNEKEFRKRKEEILEDCYTYICLNKLCENNFFITNNEFPELYHQVLTIINGLMRNFIVKVRLCHFPKSEMSFGYLTESDIFSFDADQKNLFITLKILQLIKPASKHEISRSLAEDFKHVPTEKFDKLLERYNTRFNEESIYYLVDKRLHIWINENFSEILQNRICHDDLKATATGDPVKPKELSTISETSSEAAATEEN